MRAAALRSTLIGEAREIAALRLQADREPKFDRGLAWAAPESVSGVHVFEEDGGWAADITFDGLPSTDPACIGSRGPLRDKHDATTFALSLLIDMVLCKAQSPKMPSAAWPAAKPVSFVYDGLSLPLSQETIDALNACGADRISGTYVRRRLDQIRKDMLAGAKLAPERIESFSVSERRAFLTVCALAYLKGIPGWHDESSSTPFPAKKPG